jgi:predicted DNA-binding transcriptional regulator YafY
MDSDRNEQDLPDHMQRTIDYLQENPNASTREVADALHISMRTAQRQLSQLRRMNNGD